MLANTYYVATDGSDINPGTFSLPFQHIQTAASLMVAGDICCIRSGTYRETVVPANSGTALAPITFEPYGTEAVTVSGANVVTGWTVYSGGIYEAPFTGSLGDQDQVFVDGRMMNLARWPNTTLDVSRPVKSIAASGTYNTTANPDGSYTGTYTDPALTQPAGFFNGATIHALLGPNWVAQTGTVTNYTPGTVQFKWNYWGSTYNPQAGNPYYLFGLLSLLDIPSEWFIDPNAGILYLWPPQNDSPVNHVVEAKQREYAFDLSGLSYVTVQGLSLFACAINTSPTSQYLILNNLSCSYLSHYALNSGNSGFTAHMEDSGIILNGSNNILSNSTLAYSAGNGVTLLGASNLVENCTIHDVDYLDVDCGAVNTGIVPYTSSSNEIAYNTCYNSGRDLFVIRTLQAGNIHNNLLYRSMLETTDGGAMYTFSHDGQNTVIAYNRISDNVCANNAASGIYIDNNSLNYIVHHNLVYNTSWALHYNLASQNILWYNNTAVAFYDSLSGGATGSQAGTQVINNIFTAATTTYAGATVSNNLSSTTNPLFVAPASLDFSLQGASPAVGAGMVLAPYTNGYTGTAPDLGAFAYGQTPWSAGSPVDTGIPAAPTNLTATPAGSNIQLSWTDNSGAENAQILERSTDEQTFTELTRLPANTTSYTDATVLPGTYYYRLRADESANSNYAAVTLPGHNAFSNIQAGSLDAESGLTVYPSVIGSCDNGDWAEYANVDFQTGASQISLRVASGATSVNNYIEVLLGGTSGELIADINVPGTGSYGTYTTLTSSITPVSGVENLYFLFKGGAGVCNIETFSFSPTSPVSVSAPPAPTGPTAAAMSQNQIQVGWIPPGATENGFKVERSTDNQNFVEIASVSSPASSMTDTGLSVGTTYYYRIRSFSQNGLSSYTATVSATTWTNFNAVAPSSLAYSTNPVTYTVGTPIANDTPTSSGGAVVSYSVSPALPAGLSFSTITGIITGTPTAITPTASYTVTATNTGGSTTAALTITVKGPAISVQEPVGTVLVSGSSNINFGTVQVGSSNQLALTIVNIGTANLTNLAIGTAGAGAAAFQNGALGTTSLSSGGSTTFTVSFVPTASGSAAATLQVSSNDPSIPVFDIGLAGSAVTGSNASLSGLALSSGTLAPPFASGTLNYTASVSSSTSSITVTPTVADPTATVKVNGTTVASGAASGAINLSIGSNTINVVVTAQDGVTTETYSLTITLPPPAPVITSTLTVTATSGVPFAYQIAASNTPTGYGASPLPGWLRVNTTSGLVFGTPTATGTFVPGISASNVTGTGSANLTIAVSTGGPETPQWWTNRNVLTAKPKSDYAAANQGQLKYIAVAAINELNANLYQFGGAGANLNSLSLALSSTTPATMDYAVVNLGQLKALVKPFYDQLLAVGYAQGPLASGTYPWINANRPAADFAVANIGEIKNLFSFDVTFTSDPSNPLPDWWQFHYFGTLGINPNGHAPGSALNYLQDYQQGLPP